LQEQEVIIEKFNYLPIGFRIVNRFTSRKASQFGVELQGGITPMYYLNIKETINVGLKISYRFFKELN